MKKKLLVYLSCFLFFAQFEFLNAQPWMQPPYFEIKSPADSAKQFNFYEIQKAFNAYEKDHPIKENKISRNEPESENENYFPGYMQYKRWEYYMQSRVYPSGDIRIPSRKWEEFQKYLNSSDYKNRISSQEKNQSIQSLTGNWTSLGPFTVPSNNGIGRINFIRFDPTNSNTIWVGAPSGGLWKSTDGGVTWSTNTDLLTLIGCSDVAIKPTNTNVMYVATGDGDHRDNYSIGVLKSTNGGATWNTTGLSWSASDGKFIYKLLMHPTNSNILLVAAGDGIYKTIDAGVTWTKTFSATSESYSDIEFKPGSPNVVYAVSSGWGKFYKSTNTGSSFVNITSGLSDSSYVFRYAIGVSPANPADVYLLASSSATTGFYGLFRSTNSGTTFSLQSNAPDIISYQGWYALSITINPLNANDIYVGGLYHWRSIDGGVTWSNLNYYTHADIHALEFLPGSSTTIFECNDGGVYKSTDNGTSWINLSNGLIISQMYRLSTCKNDPNFNLTGLQDNGTNRIDSGLWAQIQGGDGMECIIDYVNSNVIYAASQFGAIGKSLNRGASWLAFPITYNPSFPPINVSGAWITPYIIDPNDHNTLLVGKSQICRTPDGGSSWSQIGMTSNVTSFIALAYAPSNSNYIYAASFDKFYVSTDGNTITDRTGTLPLGVCSYLAVSNTDPQKIWMSFQSYINGIKVYASIDTGTTWSNYSTGLPNLPVNCIVYQNGTNDGLYVGTDVGVYFRSNSLSAWQPFITGLPNVMVDELEINYNTKKIRAATYGRGLWESDLAIPMADFTANPYIVCKGSSVAFSDQSSGSPSSWNWSFQGGTPANSTLQNPTVIYNTVGAFDVSLTVSNANGIHTKTSFVIINPLPSATVTPQGPTNFCTGGSVVLAANTGTGLTYQWKKGSAFLSGEISQTYTATSTGSYKVIVTNSNGCSRTSTSISVTGPPSTTITVNGSLTFCAGDSVIFTVPSIAGNQYQWKKNNVNISGATLNSYTAKNAGIYKVTVTNSFGCSKTSATKTVTVPCRENREIISENGSVKAYPIPVHDFLQLDIKDFSGKGNISTVNEFGQVVASKDVNFDLTELKSIDFRKFSSGMYSIIVSDIKKKEIINVIKE